MQHGGHPGGLLRMAAGDMVCDVHGAGRLCHDMDAHDSSADQALHGQVLFRLARSCRLYEGREPY